MIKEAILKVYKHEDLTYDEAYQTMDEIMSGEASEVQMSAYLTAMSMKGETIDEITASAEAMRAHCVRLLNDEEVLEIVGTGGDGSNTFNISTTSSIVISKPLVVKACPILALFSQDAKVRSDTRTNNAENNFFIIITSIILIIVFSLRQTLPLL